MVSLGAQQASLAGAALFAEPLGIQLNKVASYSVVEKSQRTAKREEILLLMATANANRTIGYVGDTATAGVADAVAQLTSVADEVTPFALFTASDLLASVTADISSQPSASTRTLQSVSNAIGVLANTLMHSMTHVQAAALTPPSPSLSPSNPPPLTPPPLAPPANGSVVGRRLADPSSGESSSGDVASSGDAEDASEISSEAMGAALLDAQRELHERISPLLVQSLHSIGAASARTWPWRGGDTRVEVFPPTSTAASAAMARVVDSSCSAERQIVVETDSSMAAAISCGVALGG